MRLIVQFQPIIVTPTQLTTHPIDFIVHTEPRASCMVKTNNVRNAEC